MEREFLSEEESQKLEKSLTEEEKIAARKRGAVWCFIDALQREDFDEANDQLGMMRYLKMPEAVYYRGMLKHYLKDIPGAIEEYKKVDSTLECYPDAMNNLMSAYVVSGLYFELDDLFRSGALKSSPIVQLKERLNCLSHMKIEAFLNEYERIYVLEPTEIKKIEDSYEDKEAFYHVTRVFGDMLTSAGECINQCSLYMRRVGNQKIDIESTPDLQNFLQQYKRFVYILSLSKQVKFLKIRGGDNNDVESLAICALSDKCWSEKVDIFQNTDWVNRVAQIVFNLNCPERHPDIEKKVVIGNLIEQLSNMHPHYVQSVIARYFEDITGIASEGDISFIQYIALAYSDIVVENKDPHHLKEKIERYYSKHPDNETEEMMKRRELVHIMTRKGYDALMNAERTFDETKGKNYGVRDASTLALLFFRVFEIEYNERLIKPWVKAIDINKLRWDSFVDKKVKTEVEKDIVSKWGRDVFALSDVASGRRGSLEIGTIRTLLAHVRRYKGKVGNDLFQPLLQVLTNSGKEAFSNERMIDIIGSENLEKYRNPGAHTGYLPYAEACKARDLVVGSIAEVEKWFSKEP